MKVVRLITVLIFILSSISFGVSKYIVNLRDKVPPKIVSSVESDKVIVNVGFKEKDLLQDLSATDNVDGDITEDIIVKSISQFDESGLLDIEYIVFDKSNNVGKYTRKLQIEGYTSPRFSLLNPLVYKRGSDIVVSDRLVVTDCIEGDISSNLRYSSPDLLQGEVGKYSLDVKVFNSFGDEVSLSLPINVVSYNTDRETIELSKYLIYVNAGDIIDPFDYVLGLSNVENDTYGLEDVYVTEEVDLTTKGTGQYKYELRNKNDNVVSVTYLTVIVE